VNTAIDRFGRLDVLFNNAGMFAPKPFLQVDEVEYDRFVDVILKGKFFAAQAAAKAMKDFGRGGAIVQTGSMWGLQAIGATPSAPYSAAKAGVHALTKNLAIELAPHDIRVNTVALAFVETPAYERFMSPDEAREVLDSVNAFHPLGRHGQPHDVVEAILFYASSRAAWITGTTMPIDGGVLAGRNAPPARVAEPAAA
jgi:NAD(P)-dependent dehydrogenase (short-subunit alcohol dehydrogenase family)